MNKWLELLLGLVFVLIPVYVWVMNIFGMGTAALEFFKGGAMWLAILIGVLFIILGINDLKE